MEDNNKKKAQPFDAKDNIMDSMRQFCFPAQFRIAAPLLLPEKAEEIGRVEEQQPLQPSKDDPEGFIQERERLTPKLVAELATCLWYLKTKYFKREWANDAIDDDEPRVRRALGRLNKSIDALKESNIEIHDPTNKRYPQGGEGMMKPIQFQPTAGLTFEKVTETVTPVIFFSDRLLQRGEVFVAVPQEKQKETVEQSIPTLDNSENEKTTQAKHETQAVEPPTNEESDHEFSGRITGTASHGGENFATEHDNAANEKESNSSASHGAKKTRIQD